MPRGYGLLTPAAAAARIREVVGDRPVEAISIQGAVGGTVDDLAWRNLELLVAELKPALAAPV
jgi:hypothetical protein